MARGSNMCSLVLLLLLQVRGSLRLSASKKSQLYVDKFEDASTARLTRLQASTAGPEGAGPAQEAYLSASDSHSLDRRRIVTNSSKGVKTAIQARHEAVHGHHSLCRVQVSSFTHHSNHVCLPCCLVVIQAQQSALVTIRED